MMINIFSLITITIKKVYVVEISLVYIGFEKNLLVE